MFLRKIIFIITLQVIIARKCCIGCQKKKIKTVLGEVKKNKMIKKWIENIKKRRIKIFREKKDKIEIKLSILGIDKIFTINRSRNFTISDLKENICKKFGLSNPDILVILTSDGKELNNEQTFGKLKTKEDEIFVYIKDESSEKKEETYSKYLEDLQDSQNSIMSISGLKLNILINGELLELVEKYEMTLKNVIKVIGKKIIDYKILYNEKEFNEDDYNKTLKELNIEDNSTIVLIRRESVTI